MQVQSFHATCACCIMTGVFLHVLCFAERLSYFSCKGGVMYQPPTNDPQSQRPTEPSQFPFQQPPLQPSPYPPPQYPQQPYYPPGTPPPQPKKRRTGLWIALGIIALLLFACIGFGTLALRGASTAVNSVATSVSSTLTPSSGSTPTTAATQGAPGTWKTIKTFTGNGTKKTQHD